MAIFNSCYVSWPEGILRYLYINTINTNLNMYMKIHVQLYIYIYTHDARNIRHHSGKDDDV